MGVITSDGCLTDIIDEYNKQMAKAIDHCRESDPTAIDVAMQTLKELQNG